MTDKQEPEKDTQKKTRTPALEWLFATIGLFLVVSIIGFLIYEIVTDEKKPPNLNVKIEEIIPQEKGFLIKFTLENTGDETAADVTVEGEIKKAAESIEKSDVTVDYVPSHSEKKGGMFFRENPRNAEFEIRARGYNQP
jgi:uncharacterized protein (TIGR02588 family)